ncbi:Putative aminoacrylate hydrolase RutD [Paenibacillus sp. JJ-100]|uniref:alpha/beta hydrolase n=1 Tax=Paenibacillus sp. JJ-100 TaxID=2974896 RepID=UPI0022FFA545|nr:alpha/beta hydrolase [Paenibacillus sp. JJ-100]CAI6046441.1 Putative aminoacrylate hydrolase RutD [Paenibacillus sp. JJ-100]
MTQPEGKKAKNRTRVKKVRNIILKILGAILIAIVLFLGIVYITNVISNNLEAKRIVPYGQHVSVDGKNMNVFIQGEGEETIVLLPGFGTASPALDFKPLISELAPYYKVVVVEPFGYGLSDQTERERSTANIVSEIHEALQSLHIDRYILMGHSISGIYSLNYVNKYADEVSAYVGLDTSVPAISEQKVEASEIVPIKWYRNLGFPRLQLKMSDDPYAGLPYDEQTKEQLNILIQKHMFNSTQLNEIVSMYSNFKAAEQLTFPVDLPVLFFVQKNHPAVDNWVPEHEKLMEHSARGEMVLLEANHYLYRSHAKEIAEKFMSFMTQR